MGSEWTTIAVFPHAGAFGQSGKAGYCSGGEVTIPSRVLLRVPGVPKHKPVIFQTYVRTGGDPDLSLSTSDFMKLGATGLAVEAETVEMQAARFVDRYWYSPNFKLGICVALLSWLLALAGAIYTFVNFHANRSSAHGGAATAMLALATVVFVVGAASATVKFVSDVRQMRQ